MGCIRERAFGTTYTLTNAGTELLPVLYDSNLLTSLAVTIDVTPLTGSPNVGVQISFVDWTGTFTGAGPLWLSSLGSFPVHMTLTPPAGSAGYTLRADCAVGQDGSTAEIAGDLVPTCGSSAGTYCAYGTEPNPDATTNMVIDSALLDTVVLAALAVTGQLELVPYVETALAAIEGSTIAIDCSTLPAGDPQPLNLTNLASLSPANLGQWFQRAAFNYFCQCVPAPGGSPAPVMPEPPTVITNPNQPTTQAAPTCDNTDLCAFLQEILSQVQTVTAQLHYLRQDVTMIQRQHVPFAYVPGTLHSGLTGAGQFGVQGILGLAVQVTTVPGASGEEAGDPIARFGLGWVTSGTADGWRRSVPIRHNPQWVDVEPDDTLVGYSLEPLVVVNLQEFIREP